MPLAWLRGVRVSALAKLGESIAIVARDRFLRLLIWFVEVGCVRDIFLADPDEDLEAVNVDLSDGHDVNRVQPIATPEEERPLALDEDARSRQVDFLTTPIRSPFFSITSSPRSAPLNSLSVASAAASGLMGSGNPALPAGDRTLTSQSDRCQRAASMGETPQLRAPSRSRHGRDQLRR